MTLAISCHLFLFFWDRYARWQHSGQMPTNTQGAAAPRTTPAWSIVVVMPGPIGISVFFHTWASPETAARYTPGAPALMHQLTYFHIRVGESQWAMGPLQPTSRRQPGSLRFLAKQHYQSTAAVGSCHGRFVKNITGRRTCQLGIPYKAHER